MSTVHERTLQRFVEQMQHIDEVAVITLKGHLLLEEQLERIIGTFVFHAECVRLAQLRFPQKVALARAMSLDEHGHRMWDLVLAINTFRNELAHALQSEKREQKFQRLKTLFEESTAGAPLPSHPLADKEVVLFAVAAASGFLGTFEEEVLRFKEQVDILDRKMNPHRHGMLASLLPRLKPG
jgi:hypothetical protein